MNLQLRNLIGNYDIVQRKLFVSETSALKSRFTVPFSIPSNNNPYNTTLCPSEWTTAPLLEEYDEGFDPVTSTLHHEFNPKTTLVNVRMTILQKPLPTESLSFYIIVALYAGGNYIADASIWYENYMIVILID